MKVLQRYKIVKSGSTREKNISSDVSELITEDRN